MTTFSEWYLQYPRKKARGDAEKAPGIFRKPLPSKEYLEEAFLYDEKTGNLTWKKRPVSHFMASKHKPERSAAIFNTKYAGRSAQSKAAKGYLRTTIGNTGFPTHRIIWKLLYGVDPDFIDHINGKRSDNRAENLRSVTASENSRNKPVLKSLMGETGVYLIKGRWVAKIQTNLSVLHFSSLDKDEAIAWRREMEKELNFTVRRAVS
jgi:hypothetical protein